MNKKWIIEIQGQSENKPNISIAKVLFGSVRKSSCKLCHNYFLDADNADDADSDCRMVLVAGICQSGLSTKKGDPSHSWNGSPHQNGSDLLSHLGSTIGAVGLNFSVRNGKRWNPDAIATWISLSSFFIYMTIAQAKETNPSHNLYNSKNTPWLKKPFGQLVMLGWMCLHTYTCILSTSSSLTTLNEI